MPEITPAEPDPGNAGVGSTVFVHGLLVHASTNGTDPASPFRIGL